MIVLEGDGERVAWTMVCDGVVALERSHTR